MRWPLQRKGALASLGVAIGLLGLVWQLWPRAPGVLIAVFLVGIPLTTFALVHRWVVRPVRELLDVFEDGRLLQRATHDREDEFGALGRACNRALGKLTALQAEAIDQSRELEWARERLRLEEDLKLANERLARRLREQEVLIELGRAFTATLELDEVVSTLCELVSTRLDVDEVVVLFHDVPKDELVVSAARGVPETVALLGLRFSTHDGIAGAVATSRQPVYAPDLANEPRFLKWNGRYELAAASMVACPIELEGVLLGLITFVRHRLDGFGPTEVKSLGIVATYAAVAIKNARLHHETVEMATHDALTGLLNRRAYFERMEREWSRSVRFDLWLTVLIIDVDRFKRVNDTYGHLVGDAVLEAVALTLAANVRDMDTLARYGGEEFVVLLPRTAPREAGIVAEKLRRAVEHMTLSVVAAPHLGAPTVSIGSATTRPFRSATTPRALLDQADRALLAAKEAGRNRVMEAA